MKLFSILTFLIFSTFTYQAIGQIQNLFLWDKESNQPIESALILNNQDSKESAITNSNGLFEIPESWQIEDSLFVHHVNYETTVFTLSNDLKDTLYIRPQDFVLDEVVVYAQKTQAQFLIDIVKKTQDKIKLPAKYDAYYKEFTLENGRYISFADGSMQFFLEKKRDDLNIDATLLESRAVNLETSEEIDLSLVSPINFEKTIIYKNPGQISSFLNPDNFENYNYSISDGDPLISIRVSPKKPEHGTYKIGKILVNKKDSTLNFVQFKYHPISIENFNTVNLLVVKGKLTASETSIKYKSVEDEIRLDYVRLNISMKFFNDKNIDQTNTFINDLSILKRSEKQESISWGDRYRKKSIAKNGTEYQTEFWKNASHVSLSPEELALINSEGVDSEAY